MKHDFRTNDEIDEANEWAQGQPLVCVDCKGPKQAKYRCSPCQEKEDNLRVGIPVIKVPDGGLGYRYTFNKTKHLMPHFMQGRKPGYKAKV